MALSYANFLYYYFNTFLPFAHYGFMQLITIILYIFYQLLIKYFKFLKIKVLT